MTNSSYCSSYFCLRPNPAGARVRLPFRRHLAVGVLSPTAGVASECFATCTQLPLSRPVPRSLAATGPLRFAGSLRAKPRVRGSSDRPRAAFTKRCADRSPSPAPVGLPVIRALLGIGHRSGRPRASAICGGDLAPGIAGGAPVAPLAGEGHRQVIADRQKCVIAPLDTTIHHAHSRLAAPGQTGHRGCHRLRNGLADGCGTTDVRWKFSGAAEKMETDDVFCEGRRQRPAVTASRPERPTAQTA